MTNPFVRYVMPIFVLIVGVSGLIFQFVTRPRPTRSTAQAKPTAVEVVTVERAFRPAMVKSAGTVIPAREVVLGAEVSGRVVSIHPELVAGGRVAAGELMVRLDDRQYRLAAQQAEATRTRAQFELKVEQGRRRVAEREWKLIGKAEVSPEGKSLALREPHLAAAKATLLGANSAYQRAKLDLARTRIVAPFNGFIREEAVEVGQLVTVGGRMATLVGTDAFWVQVSVSLTDLALVDVGFKDRPGSTVRVRQVVQDGEPSVREGRVIRLLKDLDPKGRMARLVVEVKDPLATDEDHRLPLLLGAFVSVEIDGRAFEDAVALPRIGLRQGDEAWVMNADKQLEVRQLAVTWRGPDTVVVRRGLAAGERVIVSRISAPVPGMALRLPGESASAPTDEREARLETNR